MKRSWRKMNINTYPRLEKLLSIDTSNLIDLGLEVDGNVLKYQVLNQNIKETNMVYSDILNRVEFHVCEYPEIQYDESYDRIIVMLRGTDTDKDKNIIKIKLESETQAKNFKARIENALFNLKNEIGSCNE